MTGDKIRSDLRRQLPRLLGRAASGRLVEEMEVCAGKARVDLAVISSQLIGVEIKGPLDDLGRLPQQAVHYSRCFDQVILVVHENLVTRAVRIAPRWWGLIVNTYRDGAFTYSVRRSPRPNRRVDIEAVLGLLWRQEIELLFKDLLDISVPPRASKRELRAQLMTLCVPAKLKTAGLALLRTRREWNSAQAA